MRTKQPISATAAARRVKLSASWAKEICSRHRIGTVVNNRLRLLWPADVSRLRNIAAKYAAGDIVR